MATSHANTNLVALDKALEAAGAAITLVMRVPAPLKPVADQVIRSASSVPANLAEGHGRSGRDRTHLWRIAYASSKEVDIHLRLLARAGVVNGAEAEQAVETFDEVRALTWRLLHPATWRTACSRHDQPQPLRAVAATADCRPPAARCRCFLPRSLSLLPATAAEFDGAGPGIPDEPNFCGVQTLIATGYRIGV